MIDQTLYAVPKVSEQIKSFFTDLEKGEMYLEEAEFGLRRILPLLRDLPAGARVLEVGSGPCIVLSEIMQRYPQLHIQGIEPMSDGFAFFNDFVGRFSDAGSALKVHLGGYESFPADGEWDLIFLVNVFEHLPDWRDFLTFVASNLSTDGRCVVLCPNYGFPYELHFRVPIFLNKAFTKKVFGDLIDRFEKKNDCTGLFRSLNFVKLAQVRQAVKTTGLELTVNTDIIREMMDRLDHDPSFRKRQGIFSLPTRLLKRTGLLEPMLRSRTIQNRLPYMQFTLHRLV